jgi:hypothetical protein
VGTIGEALLKMSAMVLQADESLHRPPPCTHNKLLYCSFVVGCGLGSTKRLGMSEQDGLWGRSKNVRAAAKDRPKPRSLAFPSSCMIIVCEEVC